MVQGQSAPTLPRRDLFKGGLLGVVGGIACSRTPTEDLIPYVVAPPEEVPGRATLYASTIERQGYAVGVLAECYGGRPVKLEGHPTHPGSLGALDAPAQALLHQLYDPARIARPGAFSSTSLLTLRSHFRTFRERSLAPSGRGLCVLLEPTSSLTQALALERLSQRYPEARLFVDDLSFPSADRRAALRAFGASTLSTVDFASLRTVVCIDDDAFVGGPESLCRARKWGPALGASDPRDKARLFVVEPTLTPTGMLADERLAATSNECGSLLLEIYRQLTRQFDPQSHRMLSSSRESLLDSRARKFARAAADELARQGSRGWVTIGPHQPEAIHILGFAINRLLHGANFGYPDQRLGGGDERFTLGGARDLLEELRSGRVQALVSLADNPWYSWPERSELSDLLRRVPFSVQSALYYNETAERTKHYVRRAHALESFDALHCVDGALSLSQPLLRPLADAVSPARLLLSLCETELGEKAFLKETIRVRRGGDQDLDASLAAGWASDTSMSPLKLKLDPDAVAAAARTIGQRSPSAAPELLIREETKLAGGRQANNGMLQELPDAVTKIVWDNVLLVHPQTGREKGLEEGARARVVGPSGSIELPVLFEPSQAPGVFTTTLGYGRDSSAEPTARGVGVDIGPLRSWKDPWQVLDFEVEPRASHGQLARTQHEFSDHERSAALRFTAHQFEEDPGLVAHHAEPPESIMPPLESQVRQWGMSVDLSACMGCGACVVACQVENSVPTVGPQEARLGRVMHWLRIDRYEKESNGQTVSVSQPMACQHCEQAPCEYVCPVGATTHSPDGLNEMTYNRCVGTRYCSNNCPYKVRRFNYLSYDQGLAPTRKMEKSPNVSVRSRGVMEKCTYCVQRIRRAEIDARLSGLPRSSAKVVTACQQTCPTGAIHFGSVSDRDSEVSQRIRSPRAYSALNELGVRPRTRYLAKITMPLSGDGNARKEEE